MPRKTIVAPHAGQVVRIKRMGIDRRFFSVVRHTSSVLTARTRLPAWTWSRRIHLQPPCPVPLSQGEWRKSQQCEADAKNDKVSHLLNSSGVVTNDTACKT